MSKIEKIMEKVLDSTGPEINPVEAIEKELVSDVVKIPEGEIAPEKLEKPKEVSNGQKQENEQEQEEKLELPLEEQIKNLEEKRKNTQEEVARLTGVVEDTKGKINEIRIKMGLPPTDEYPPSVSSEKDKLKTLQAEQAVLKEQKENLISLQEKEQLVRKEKEKIIQEKLDEVFKEIKELDASDFESIFQSGKTAEGKNFESRSMGEFNPEVAMAFTKAFKEGVKLFPKIFKDLPKILKELDNELTKEAVERVEKKLEEEKQQIEREQKKENISAKPEEPDSLKLKEKIEIAKTEIPEISIPLAGNK